MGMSGFIKKIFQIKNDYFRSDFNTKEELVDDPYPYFDPCIEARDFDYIEVEEYEVIRIVNFIRDSKVEKSAPVKEEERGLL